MRIPNPSLSWAERLKLWLRARADVRSGAVEISDSGAIHCNAIEEMRTRARAAIDHELDGLKTKGYEKLLALHQEYTSELASLRNARRELSSAFSRAWEQALSERGEAGDNAVKERYRVRCEKYGKEYSGKIARCERRLNELSALAEEREYDLGGYRSLRSSAIAACEACEILHFEWPANVYAGFVSRRLSCGRLTVPSSGRLSGWEERIDEVLPAISFETHAKPIKPE